MEPVQDGLHPIEEYGNGNENDHSQEDCTSQPSKRPRPDESDPEDDDILSRRSSDSGNSYSSTSLAASSDCLPPSPPIPQSCELNPPPNLRPWRIEWTGPDGKVKRLAKSPQNQKRLYDTSTASLSKAACVVMDPRSSVCLVGRGRIRSRSGVGLIHGCEMRPIVSSTSRKTTTNASVAVDFISPSWNSMITIEAGDSETKVELLPPIAISNDNSTAPSSGPKSKKLPPFVTVMDATSSKARPTIYPESWKQAVDSILKGFSTHQSDLNRSQSSMFSVALTGGKSTGKSTCLRYLVNRLLCQNVDRVAVLDADCGQPELGPPGMVTLTLIDRPLLQPPHTHPFQQHQHAAFFGSVTSQVDPQRYISCIQELVNASQTLLDHSIPLCINLDGWVKGLGEQVLHSLLDMMLPTHIIQLVGKTKSQQFHVNVDPAKTRLHQVLSFNNRIPEERNPEIPRNESSDPLPVGSNTDETLDVSPQPPLLLPPSSLSISASLLRTLRIATYFLQDVTIWDRVTFSQTGIVDPDCEIAETLASQRPYSVPFAAVEWGFASPDDSRSIRSESSMLDVLNASIVGLCCRDVHSTQVPYHLLPCVGLGIVRSIDRRKSLFYILTPVPASLLQQRVNCLVHGTLRLPVECWFRGVNAETFPYMSFDVANTESSTSTTTPTSPNTTTEPIVILGNDPMYSRNTIARRGLANNSSKK